MSKNIAKFILIIIISIVLLIGMSTIIRAQDLDNLDDLLNEDAAEEFRIAEESIDVKLNNTYRLHFYNKPSEGTITFSSSDPSVATVTEFGEITGIKIGRTTITATATSGGQTSSCEVTVVYGSLSIKSNSRNSITSTNLVLEEHPTETLIASVEDGNFVEVENPVVKWTSNNSNVVTVDNNGKVTAVSEGTATITAEAAGVSDTCEINVASAPKFTDFSNAKYELLFDTDVDLKIAGITPIENNDYYYIITPNNTKPAISITSYGALDTEVTEGADYLSVNTKENYLYRYNNLDRFVELNQDLYLWIIESAKLDASYYKDEENNYISSSTKFIVEGEKLTRPELPQLNLILKSLSIWGGEKENQESTYISFRFPSAVKNRKFKLKIGKITDYAILEKIQNNDYSGITALLQYAKNNQAIYTADLITTSENYYRNDQALFDGTKILEDRAYYYIYVEFEDEEGKYYPIEGVTLGQAWVSDSKKHWDLWAYTADNFEWNNLSNSEVENVTPKDETIAKDKLPNAGTKVVIIISIFVLAGVTVFFRIKNDKYKEI